jgi:ankyrin repeat domain-containing protein 50
MDGLSAAASIIAVLQISESVISACRQYYKTAKNARKDILEIISMVHALKGTLDTIKALLDEDDSDNDDDDDEDPRIPLLQSLEPSFAACEEAMRGIAQRLGIELGVEVDPGTLKVSFKKKATWPWKEKEVAKILQSIEKFKTIFILALNGETLQVVRAIQESVKDISESIQKFTLSDKHKRILKWLKSSDPSVNHNAARKKHEPTTGDWLLESEIFINWKKATKSSIWINGKPGAGKTILCSTITEHIKCSIGSADSYAYFYFDFSDAEKQKVTSMLSSIVAQLSIPNLPAEVDDLYNKCKEGQQQPSQDDLVKILIAQCKESQRTYLIVDALDECSERKDILLALRRIIEASVQVNVLVTSREEHDISEGLRDVIPKSVSLECGGLDKDIERHIQRCLEKDGEWRKDPSYVKKEIQDALVKGAHGM